MFRHTAHVYDLVYEIAGKDYATESAVLVDGWIRPDAWRDRTVHAISGVKDGLAVARVGRSHRRGDTAVLEMHHLVATADGVEHLVDHHELTLFADDDYLRAFRQAGLGVDVIAGPYPDRARYAGRMP